MVDFINHNHNYISNKNTSAINIHVAKMRRNPITQHMYCHCNIPDEANAYIYIYIRNMAYCSLINLIYFFNLKHNSIKFLNLLSFNKPNNKLNSLFGFGV